MPVSRSIALWHSHTPCKQGNFDFLCPKKVRDSQTRFSFSIKILQCKSCSVNFERPWFRSIRAIFTFFLHGIHGLSTSNSLSVLLDEVLRRVSLMSVHLCSQCRCRGFHARPNQGEDICWCNAGANMVHKAPTISYPLAEAITKWAASFFSVLWFFFSILLCLFIDLLNLGCLWGGSVWNEPTL